MNKKQNTYVYWRMFTFDTKLAKKEFEIFTLQLPVTRLLSEMSKQQQEINYLQIF